MAIRMRWKAPLLVLSGGVVAAASLVILLTQKEYDGFFRREHGTLIQSEAVPSGGDSLTGKFWVALKNDRGLSVECGLLVPRREGRKYPAIILLGGKATGKHAVDYAFSMRDAVIASPDYPFEARDSYTVLQFLKDAPAIRRGLIEMVPSVMLLTDYLFRRNDVDTTKVILLGYSFGAPLVPCIVAQDRRSAVAAMVYGGGDLPSLIRHNVARYKGPLVSNAAGFLGWLLLHPLEPLRYAGRISPTPLVMINGSEDEQVPPENARMLFAAARDPKKQIWLESRHVNPANVDLTGRIIDTLKHELIHLKVLDTPDSGERGGS